MNGKFFCSRSRRSEVAVELVQLAEGEAEMQSRHVERNLGRGFITLIVVATLFVSVAIPSTSFAKPEGEPDKKTEVVLWHKVWEKDKASDKFLKKFTEADLKAKEDKDDDTKSTPSEKVSSWMKLFEKKDEAKQSEFISKFVTDPGVEKKENIEPFKMVQAIRSMMIEQRRLIDKDVNVKERTPEQRQKEVEAKADQIWKWLDVNEIPGLEKAYGSKAKALSELSKRVVKVLSKLSDEELKSMTEEDLIKKIFTDELKKELGLDQEKKGEEKPGDEEPKKGDDKKIKDLEAELKKLQDALAAKNNATPATPPVAPPTGEVDLSGIEQAVQAACANQDNDDQLGDLAKALEDKINDLERQLADNVNDDQNNQDQALLDALIAGLANDKENDENKEAEQAQAAQPAASPTVPPTQTADNSGDSLPETPQPVGPPPTQPQQASSFFDSEPVKAVVNGLRGPVVDFRDGLIAASRGVLANMKDELGMGGLLGGMSAAINPLMNPIEKWRLASMKKMQAYSQYSEAKSRRDQHAQAAEAIRNDLRSLEAGMDPLFAKFNPQAALVLQKADSKIKELQDQKKSLQQQSSQQNADGTPAFDRNSVQQQISAIDSAIRRQEEEIQNQQQAKANFIATQDTSFKDLKAAMEKHSEYESEFGSQVKKFANDYQQALSDESAAQMALQQPQQGVIPTLGGAATVPFQTSQGYNRFNQGVTTGSSIPLRSSDSAARGSLAGGPQR